MFTLAGTAQQLKAGQETSSFTKVIHGDKAPSPNEDVDEPLSTRGNQEEGWVTDAAVSNREIQLGRPGYLVAPEKWRKRGLGLWKPREHGDQARHRRNGFATARRILKPTMQ